MTEKRKNERKEKERNKENGFTKGGTPPPFPSSGRNWLLPPHPLTKGTTPAQAREESGSGMHFSCVEGGGEAPQRICREKPGVRVRAFLLSLSLSPYPETELGGLGEKFHY